MSEEPTVTLRQGTYKGFHIPADDALPKSIDAFLGIPFAQSTAGENRFRRPVGLGASDGVFEAKTIGDVCPATVASEMASLVGLKASEDCLNLNVWRVCRGESPCGGGGTGGGGGGREGGGAADDGAVEKKKEEEKGRGLMPVVVYVHGGAFNMGFGGDRNMLNFVAFAEGDIVGVSFNYRLGVLGFLPLGEETGEDGPLNVGLWDQRMAFEWVRDNIGVFGGDAGNVTLMGISAGGHSVGHHLLSYTPSTAPFHKSILESGSPTSRSVLYPHSTRHASQLQSFLAHTRTYLPSSPENLPAILSALRALPVAALTKAALSVWAEHALALTWPFQPVIDGALIPRTPLVAWEDGHGLRRPLITGFCTNEASTFVPAAHTPEAFRQFFTTLIPSLSHQDLERLDDLYPPPDVPGSPYAAPPPTRILGPHWRRLEAAYAHYAYIAPILQTAHYASLASLSNPPSNKTTPVYVYEFAPLSPPYRTANHTDSSPPISHDIPSKSVLTRLPLPGLEAISHKMHALFTRFVTSPDGSMPDEWPAFISPLSGRDGAGKILVFGEGNDERMGPDGEGNPGVVCRVRSMSEREVEQCRFWWERVQLSQGFGT